MKTRGQVLRRCLTVTVCTWLMVSGLAKARPAYDPTPRTAILSAFPPEWDALIKTVKNPVSTHINGMRVVTGTMQGKRVVLMMSGVSMVNAAMNTQGLLDRFRVSRIIFSGIAGGIDPALKVGDVVVPKQWASSLDVAMARETPNGFERPPYYAGHPQIPGFGMMYPVGVRVGNAKTTAEYRLWFEVDPDLLKRAEGLETGLTLKACNEAKVCLSHTPKVVIGGAGVSSPAFIDNAAYREYLFTTFGARAADMETSAVAQVAFANQVPFIAFRSLSDLAGGSGQANEMQAFMGLASENSAHVVMAYLKRLPADAKVK